MFLNEVNNDQATLAMETVKQYALKNSLGFTLNVMSVDGNRTDSKMFLEAVCNRYHQSLVDDQAPHIVFDTTISGLASETAKSITSSLALPTVSASYGQEGDLRQWRDIKGTAKSSYLLQVMPPVDMIPEVIRSIVQYMNITNAAILFDETFGTRIVQRIFCRYTSKINLSSCQ